MTWDPTKPAGADAANTIGTTTPANFAALDTWASAITNGVAQAGAAIFQMLRSANAVIIKLRAAAADTTDRFEMDLNGQMQWGPGNAALDTTLARTAVGVLSLNGSALSIVPTIASGTNVSFASTTSEITVCSGTLNANTLGTAGRMRYRLRIVDAGTSGTINMRFYLGSTVVIARAPSAGAVTTTFLCDVDLANMGATNSQWVTLQAFDTGGLVSGTPNTTSTTASGFASGIAVDTTVAQTVKITVQPSASLAVSRVAVLGEIQVIP